MPIISLTALVCKIRQCPVSRLANRMNTLHRSRIGNETKSLPDSCSSPHPCIYVLIHSGDAASEKEIWSVFASEPSSPLAFHSSKNPPRSVYRYATIFRTQPRCLHRRAGTSRQDQTSTPTYPDKAYQAIEMTPIELSKHPGMHLLWRKKSFVSQSVKRLSGTLVCSTMWLG